MHPLPLLLPLVRLMLKLCPSSLGHTLEPLSSVHSSYRGLARAKLGHPRAFPCSFLPKAAYLWVEGSPYPAARIKIPRPIQKQKNRTHSESLSR
jgi:hypothetical protein